MCCCGVIPVADEPGHATGTTPPTGDVLGDALFVAVEGIDRSGKTTLITALDRELRAAGRRVCVRTEPSAGPIGVFFRRISVDAALPAYAAALLSAADRHQQQPALARALRTHDVVLSDRYYLSGLAYHHADGVAPHRYQALNAGIRRPDLYVFLTVDPAVAARRGEPALDRWEHPDLSARLPTAYATGIDLVTSAEQADVLTIDANRPAPYVLSDALTALAALRQKRNLTP